MVYVMAVHRESFPMYDAYIDGLKELDEINREFNAHYEVDDKRGGNRGGCSMI